MGTSSPGTITIPETARRFGVSLPTLRKAIDSGEVPFRVVRVGKRDRVVTADVDAAIGSLDVNAARRYLTAMLPDGESVEIDDASTLDRAAAVIAGGPK